MNQNNNIPVSEYTFPQNKEQFKQVLKQAREGQYMQAKPEYESSNQPIWDKYAAYAESLSQRPQREKAERGTVQSGVDKPKQAPDFRQPAYSEQLTPVKKKFNPLLIILPLILLIVAAAVVFFLFLNNNVSYRRAEENYFGGMLKNVTAAINGSDENDTFYKADIKISAPAAGIADINISEVTINADAVKQDETVYGLLSAVIEDESVTLESWTDPANRTCTLLFPEISDIYLNLKPFGNKADYVGMCRDVLGKTLETYFELIGEPEAEKNANFTVNESSFGADKYMIHLDGVQLATVERAFLVNVLANDSAVSALCEKTGCETKEELIENERVKAVFDHLEKIITGEEINNDYIDMTVYVKNKTVIGREICYTIPDINIKTFYIYDIPTQYGQLNHIYYCNHELKTEKKDEIYITRENETSGKDVHSGRITAGFNEDTVTLNYTDFAVTKELFQGKINMTSESNPALAINAELTTDGRNRLLSFSIPNIINADVTMSPSELEYKELPELSAGEYAELSVNSDNESAEFKQFQNDFIDFVHKIMEIELYDNKNDSDNNGEKNDSNENGLLSNPTVVNTAEPTDTPTENTPDDDLTNNREKQENTQETEASVTETPVTAEAVSTAAPTTVPTITYHAPSTLDTGDAQKISGTELDSFNSGNYYTAEIYVDGGANAGGNVTVSELNGEFDDYIKGKVLQIDFAEGYEFDSALVVLTFPYGTVSGGRHYPYSDALEGLDRYMVLGSEDGEKDKEIEFYRYSGNQIGFIAEGSGYFYVVDLDRYFFEEFGKSPEEIAG